ncbi:Rieske 2Fe-2S domain-containing protein [Modestobacter sp. I12A-02628]|uniref:Rieske 2Fe-2S domain-containing protein n=1 Tax=Goekera deserti TaxID=2497753 RepID=A0A7K3WBZ5_9ACTN|nr:Rieske 2Fe-2S domain-containing protein [Goekera deserti]MPQ98419.1 Rieske 2Fe-2S domain-containing protein [Goekera deserti]NDI48246.1 Rieske 2Fe-2S domain-containing protein [Goekera deserti]NEL53995.1 Rieske 2Fe-2S domain-containing protein [Goekera deserti]
MTSIADRPVGRATRHAGPDHLVLSEHPVFRRFWYATGFAAAVDTGPVKRTVLGVDLVLWRPESTAPVSVALDRCAHRDAPLSRGWVADCHLVCPYHGWEWDADGRTQRIPQTPGAPLPTKSGLTMVASQERYGMVWVCLATEAEGGPITGVPEVPQYGAPGWRAVPEYEWPFACTAMHLLENNLDPGHVAFVHRNTFGDIDRPEVTDTVVTREPYGLSSYGEIPVGGRPGEVGTTLRCTVSQLHLPFSAHIHITYPDGLQHVMVKAITPVDDRTCLLTQTVLRTDTEADRPAADILAFDDEVEAEDRDLLESLPADFPLAPHLNAHAAADRNSLAIRRLWTDLVTGRWTPPAG